MEKEWTRYGGHASGGVEKLEKAAGLGVMKRGE